MTRSGITLCSWNSPAPSAGNTGLYLQMCVRQTVQLTQKPGQLQNLATDAGMCVHCTRHMSMTPASWCSASVTYGQAYHKTSKLLVNGESGCVHAWRQKTSLWTSAKLKPVLFRANTLHGRLFSEPPAVCGGKDVVSRLFCHRYLKANKISQKWRDKESWIYVSFLKLCWCCL